MHRCLWFSSLAIIAMFISPWSCVRAYQVNPAHYDIQKIARLDQKYSGKTSDPYGPTGSYKRYNPDYDDWLYYVKEPHFHHKGPFYGPHNRPQHATANKSVLFERLRNLQQKEPKKTTPKNVSSLVDPPDPPFGYDEADGNGPSRWPRLYPQCGGRSQSPMAVRRADATRVIGALPFRTSGFDNLPVSMLLENTGIYAKYITTYAPNETPTVTGGPLDSAVYVLDHFHFHWGLQDNRGSEHMLDGVRYPLEMHLAFWNEKYGSFEEAGKHPDGLMAYLWMVEIGDNSRPSYFSEWLPKVEEPFTDFEIKPPNTFSLTDVIGTDLKWEHLTYSGGLTTPPCFEPLQWVINVNPIKFPLDEILALRNLKFASGKPMGDNFRPLQLPNGREVFSYPDISS